MASHARNKLDLIAALVRLNVQIFIHFVAFEVDAKLDRLGIACADTYAAIIRVNAHISATRHGVVLGPFCGACARREAHSRK
jgi:hypothetical protein